MDLIQGPDHIGIESFSNLANETYLYFIGFEEVIVGTIRITGLLAEERERKLGVDYEVGQETHP
jgi:hypothetical protein